MRRSRLLDNRGDTLVEVLIAIAVVSAVLGGAFAASRRSLNGARVSQERGEAVKLVEGQIESLKSILASPDKSKADQIFGLAGAFCLDDTLGVVTDVNDTRCHKGPGGRYRLSISSTDISGTTGKTFTASALWDKVGGGPRERVDIVYKAYHE